MTSASELFYQRRSRAGRVTTTDPEFDPLTARLFYSRRHRHSHRHDFDVSERAPVRVDQATSQPSINTEGFSSSSSTNRARLSGNDRLPGAVLLARARLVERLRGVSASSNRRSSRVSFDISNRDYIYTSADDLQVGAVDLGVGSEWSTRGTPSSGSTNQTERSQKPPGLTSEDINSLQLEIFSIAEEKVVETTRDCSICLESFEEGDKLIHLPCEHRFHASCLCRWIRTCGDCPYCRRVVVICDDM